jgi:hypothetical protein
MFQLINTQYVNVNYFLAVDHISYIEMLTI